MFFKNIFVFAFTRKFTHTQAQLETLLQESSFTPLGSTEMRHFGFIGPLGKYSDELVIEAGGNFLLCARSEEKILPAPVIKDAVEAKVDLLEIEQGRSATKKEKEQIKEDVIFELLPRAFNRVNDTHAYISPENNTIVVEASSRGKAEDLLALLRKTLGTLPVTSLSPDSDVNTIMTEWVQYEGTHAEKLGGKFGLGYEAELHAVGDQMPVVKVKDMTLDSDEFRVHLDADMFITKLALEYEGDMSFMLNDDLSIKRIKFSDVIHEQNDDIPEDDLQGKLEADFVLGAGELNRMINDLLKEFNVGATDYLEQ